MKKPVFMFDLGNVLIDFCDKELMTVIAEESGLPFDSLWEDRIDKDIKAVETGKLSPQDYFERQIRSKIPHWEYEDLIQLWYDVFHINPRGRGIFLNLKSKGFNVNILSNLAEFNKIAVDRKFPGFFNESSVNFFSYELGFHKPDIRIYERAAELAGAEPDECVFCDDRPENVEGAKKAGWNAFLFTPETIDSVEESIYGMLETG